LGVLDVDGRMMLRLVNWIYLAHDIGQRQVLANPSMFIVIRSLQFWYKHTMRLHATLASVYTLGVRCTGMLFT
jgi:hypothetical protein